LLAGEKTFLANYTDGLSDLHLPTLINLHHMQQSVGTFASVRPSQSFHAVSADPNGRVRTLTPICDADVWMNGGFFVFDQEIFSWMHEGEELVLEPFRRLADAGRLGTLRHEGFWSCMDTFKEKQALDERVAKGDSPWEIWNNPAKPACRADTVVSPLGGVLEATPVPVPIMAG
jgi:glucose-1-phosphate cytidylyltransferase